MEWLHPYHHLFCCNVLAHDLLGGSICHGNPYHRFYNLQVFLLKDIFLKDLRNPPTLNIRCKPIRILPTQQPNRILIHKLTHIRLVIPEEVVMQLSFKVAIMVLQAEGLVRLSRYVRFAIQFASTVIIPEPNQVAVLIWRLSCDTDLVEVE